MQYANQSTGQAPQKTTLTGDMQRNLDRVGNLQIRLAKICDTLQGPRPRDVGKEGPVAASSFRRDMNILSDIISVCEIELNCIETELGMI